MKMRVCCTVLAPGDFSGSNPPSYKRLERLALHETLPCFVHRSQGRTQSGDGDVSLRESEKEESFGGVGFHQRWKRLVKSCDPHQRPPPLAYRTVADSAETRLAKLQGLHRSLS